MGATAGRTTLNGEGLQHEDGHSHLIALTVPTCRAYDPAFGYELAVIIEEGINAMFVRERGVLLLPHGLQRELRHAGDARRGGPRRHHPRALPVQDA